MESSGKAVKAVKSREINENQYISVKRQWGSTKKQLKVVKAVNSKRQYTTVNKVVKSSKKQ